MGQSRLMPSLTINCPSHSTAHTRSPGPLLICTTSPGSGTSSQDEPSGLLKQIPSLNHTYSIRSHSKMFSSSKKKWVFCSLATTNQIHVGVMYKLDAYIGVCECVCGGVYTLPCRDTAHSESRPVGSSLISQPPQLMSLNGSGRVTCCDAICQDIERERHR